MWNDFVLSTGTVWQYGSSLETDSPRFTRPGVFFIYIMFVGTVILVSLSVATAVGKETFLILLYECILV